jgi:acetolactate synthase-1/2/3 large subunit
MDTALARQMTGGRFIAETLHSYGIDHVFFMDAILRRALVEMEELGIRRILTHSEKAAAYMADGYARTRNGPGVCMAQSVGAANLAAGLQDAYLGNSAVIALTGRQVAANQYRNAYQEIHHEQLFAAVTKFSGRVDDVGQLPLLLRRAFCIAGSGTPRPVHLDIAGHTGDVTGLAQITHPVQFDEAFRKVPPFRPLPDAPSLARACEALERAQRPVIVADIGTMVSQAEQAVVALAEKLSIPVVASLDGKAVMVEDHPLNAGIVGTYSRACANRLVAEADLVFFAGSNTGDQVTNRWNLIAAGTKMIQVDIDASELGRNYAGAILLHGDVRAALEELLRLCGTKSRPEWLARTATLVREWQEQVRPRLTSDAVPMRPERLCKELGDWLPDDAIIVADTGYSSQWAGTMVSLRKPTQRFLRAAGSLGWSFPAAMGAKCAAPEQPVICFTGDGGFMYHLCELETARRWGIKTITVVNDNHRLAQGENSINEVYKGRQGNKDDLSVFRETDFARIAEDFDCLGLRVEKPEQLRGAFEQALASERPVVIDVLTDGAAHCAGPWMPPVNK